MNTLLGLIVLILDIVAIIDCVKSAKSTGKKLLWILLILIVVEQTSTFTFLFDEQLQFVSVTLPWGEVITYPDAKMSMWAGLEWLILLSMIAFFIFATLRQYLSGERRKAILIGVGVAIFMGCILNDVAVDWDLIKSTFILEQGFVTVIVAMSLSLSDEIIQTENNLAILNLELENRIDERTRALSLAKQRAETANRAKPRSHLETGRNCWATDRSSCSDNPIRCALRSTGVRPW